MVYRIPHIAVTYVYRTSTDSTWYGRKRLLIIFFLSIWLRHINEQPHCVHAKALFRDSVQARTDNHKNNITRLFFQANHSSLESQVELTGMLSSREQNPFPIPPFSSTQIISVQLRNCVNSIKTSSCVFVTKSQFIYPLGKISSG